MEQEYTISLFTEDHIGILNQITIILTRRQINIESITASESAVKGVQMLTLVVKTSAEMVQKVVRQMQKLVDVLKVFVHTSDEIIYQEIALYKVKTKGLMSGNPASTHCLKSCSYLKNELCIYKLFSDFSISRKSSSLIIVALKLLLISG